MNDFELVRQALGSLELYSTFYASSEPFQVHKAQVAAIIEHHGNGAGAHGNGEFLKAFAAAIRKL